MDKILSPEEKFANKFMYILCALAFVFYFNTIFNNYALDDNIVIAHNKYTQKGLAGIPDLIFRSSFDGFFGNKTDDVSVRYRPLVMVSYAIEVAVLKDNPLLPNVSHFINVLIFCISVFFVFKLSYNYIFKKDIIKSIAVTTLFVIHPIHTEAIANIKGRDELLSFLFAIASCYYFLKHYAGKKTGLPYNALLLFTCALFSKENTITFLIIIPLAVYFFSDIQILKNFYNSIPLLIISVVFLYIRFELIGYHKPSNEILNNPFLHSSVAEKIATIFITWFWYIKLLLFPHPLNYDYSYNVIPIVRFNDYRVWISIIITSSTILFSLMKLKDKSVLSFAILFYFISIIVVSNIFVNLGALLGERLIYTPSFGIFIIGGIAIAWLYKYLKQHLSIYINSFYLFSILIILLCGFKTITRNSDWKDNLTLIIHDAETSKNSVKANDAASVTLFWAAVDSTTTPSDKEKYLRKAIVFGRKAIDVMPDFADAYINEGVVYLNLGNEDSTEYFWRRAKFLNPNHPLIKNYYDKFLANIYIKKAEKEIDEKDYNRGIINLNKATSCDPANPNIYYIMGNIYYKQKQFNNAIFAYKRTLLLNSGHTDAIHKLSQIDSILTIK